MTFPLRYLAAAFVLLAAAAAAWRIWRPHVQAKTDPKGEAERRVATARDRCDARIRAVVQQAGLSYPPREIFLRAFKREAALEVWARDNEEPFRLLATWRVLKSSGSPGPKRREGDRQVPEGFYRIDRFNPLSSFHLSLGLDYPNAADRILSDRERPGSDIFIHGKDVTVGCLPLGDEAIEELYLLALDTRGRSAGPIQIHIFPTRMHGPEWETFRQQHTPELQRFWQELQPVFECFEKTHVLPEVRVDPGGRYFIP